MYGTRAFVLVTLITAVGASSCDDSPSGNELDPAFYDPPDPLPSETLGTLIRSQEMEPFADGMKVWRVLYVSEALDGTPIAVSGMVAAPTGSPPAVGYDVVTWGHGTKGVADPCTPSRFYRSGFHDFFDIAPELVAAGYVGVASDYEGLGTPGIHPYLVGASEGRGQLDIVKAARQIDEAGAGSRVVIWGRSQGGHAALFSGEIAPDWAPELEVMGVIAAAPASELVGIVGFGPVVPGARGFIWQMSVGFEAVYDDLSIDDIYTEDAVATMRGLIDQEACGGEWGEVSREVENAGFATNPGDLPAWAERLEQNSPARARTEVPILLLQGTDDEVVPKVLTDILNTNLCAIESQVDYRVFEGFGHNDSTLMNMPLMLEWTAARFAGEPAMTTCE